MCVKMAMSAASAGSDDEFRQILIMSCGTPITGRPGEIRQPGVGSGGVGEPRFALPLQNGSRRGQVVASFSWPPEVEQG